MSNVRAAPLNECKIEMWHNNMAFLVDILYSVGAIREKVSYSLYFAVELGNKF